MRDVFACIVVPSCFPLDQAPGKMGFQVMFPRACCRYASQLKMLAPNHPMALRAAAGEEMFARAVEVLGDFDLAAGPHV